MENLALFTEPQVSINIGKGIPHVNSVLIGAVAYLHNESWKDEWK